MNYFKTKIKRLRNVKLLTKTLVWMIRVFEFRIFGFLTFFFIDSGSKEKLCFISDKPYVFLLQYLVANNLVCFTTGVPDTSDTSEVHTKQVQHEWDTSETSDTSAKQTTRVQHDWKILILITTRLKMYFYTPILANERVQGEEQFCSKNYFLEIPSFHTKMHLKSTPQKLNFAMAKSISKVIH